MVLDRYLTSKALVESTGRSFRQVYYAMRKAGLTAGSGLEMLMSQEEAKQVLLLLGACPNCLFLAERQPDGRQVC